MSFVSMVSHRDLVMYLVAIRSLYAQIGEGAITVIDDGSLTAADITILHRLLSDPLSFERTRSTPARVRPAGPGSDCSIFLIRRRRGMSSRWIPTP